MAAPILKKLFSILPLLLILLGNPSFSKRPGDIPVTRSLDYQPRTSFAKAKTLPADLVNFVHSVQDGQASHLVGVYAEDSFALPIVQQPAGQPVFVSDRNGVVTEFGMAAQYGTTGLLAHNTLAGGQFASLQMGQSVALVYGTGSVRFYTITTIRRFKALQPESPFSYFTDFSGSSKEMSSGDLFNEIYTRGNQLVFQTCIDGEGNPSWGRLFIIATPLAEQAEGIPVELRSPFWSARAFAH